MDYEFWGETVQIVRTESWLGKPDFWRYPPFQVWVNGLSHVVHEPATRARTTASGCGNGLVQRVNRPDADQDGGEQKDGGETAKGSHLGEWGRHHLTTGRA